MSLICRTYSCDSGGDAAEPHFFEVIEDRDTYSRFCPQCGAPVEGVDPIPSRIAIGGSAAARSADMTYRLLEESSIARSQAAEEAGLSSAQARSLKVTDMKDNLREGDVAAKAPQLPNNDVGRFMQQAESVGIKYGFQQPMAPGAGEASSSRSARLNPRVNDPWKGNQYTGPANFALGAVQGDGGQVAEQTKSKMIRTGQINRGRG